MKSVLRGLKNSVMSYSEIEILVRDCTCNEKWFATTQQLQVVARATNDYQEYPKLFRMLWKRLCDAERVLHVHKSLILIEYLLRYGSERFINDCRSRAREIARLTKYQHYNSQDEEDGSGVRLKAKQVYDLLTNDERLAEERKKADDIRASGKLHGFGSEVGGLEGASGGAGGAGGAQTGAAAGGGASASSAGGAQVVTRSRRVSEDPFADDDAKAEAKKARSSKKKSAKASKADETDEAEEGTESASDDSEDEASKKKKKKQQAKKAKKEEEEKEKAAAEEEEEEAAATKSKKKKKKSGKSKDKAQGEDIFGGGDFGAPSASAAAAAEPTFSAAKAYAQMIKQADQPQAKPGAFDPFAGDFHVTKPAAAAAPLDIFAAAAPATVAPAPAASGGGGDWAHFGPSQQQPQPQQAPIAIAAPAIAAAAAAFQPKPVQTTAALSTGGAGDLSSLLGDFSLQTPAATGKPAAAAAAAPAPSVLKPFNPLSPVNPANPFLTPAAVPPQAAGYGMGGFASIPSANPYATPGYPPVAAAFPADFSTHFNRPAPAPVAARTIGLAFPPPPQAMTFSGMGMGAGLPPLGTVASSAGFAVPAQPGQFQPQQQGKPKGDVFSGLGW